MTEYTGSAPRTHHRAETGTEDPPLRTIWPAPHEQPDPKVWPPEIERAHGSETKSEAHKAHGARQIKTPKGALPATPDQARSNNTTRRSWCRTSLHDKHEVNPRCDQSPRKMVDQLLPGRCSFRSWGSPTTRLYSPRESVPAHCGLDSAWADALLGFRLLRDFSPEVARNAFTPSTLSGFTTDPIRRPCIWLPHRA